MHNGQKLVRALVPGLGGLALTLLLTSAPLGAQVFDSDGDTIPDSIECPGDPDDDGDGDSDQKELYGDSGLPPVFSQVPIERTVSIRVNDLVHLVGLEPAVADHDADGIPNWLDTWDEDGPEGDADGDGVPNWREEKLGTNPTIWRSSA